MKKKGQLEKQARRLLTKSADIVMSEGDKHEEMCGLVDVIADLLFAGRLSDIDPTKSVEETPNILYYMDCFLQEYNMKGIWQINHYLIPLRVRSMMLV